MASHSFIPSNFCIFIKRQLFSVFGVNGITTKHDSILLIGWFASCVPICTSLSLSLSRSSEQPRQGGGICVMKVSPSCFSIYWPSEVSRLAWGACVCVHMHIIVLQPCEAFAIVAARWQQRRANCFIAGLCKSFQPRTNNSSILLCVQKDKNKVESSKQWVFLLWSIL